MTVVAALKDVTVRRGISVLLDSVNLSIGEDERWVLLGPNGAGKTTLLSILAANLFPTSGTVQLLDEVLGKVDVFELRPRIGLTSSALAGVRNMTAVMRDGPAGCSTPCTWTTWRNGPSARSARGSASACRSPGH